MPHVQTRKYRRGYLVLNLIHIASFQHNTKTHLVSPTGVESSQSALFKIAKLLHNDATPIIDPLPTASQLDSTNNAPVLHSNGFPTSNTNVQPLHSPPSEGVSNTQSSEGITSTGSDRLKTSITPVNTNAIPTHPSLYSRQLTEVDISKSQK